MRRSFFLLAFLVQGYIAPAQQPFHFIFSYCTYENSWGVKWSVVNETTRFTYEVYQFKKEKWEKIGEVQSAATPDTLVYFFPFQKVKKGTAFFKIRTSYGNETNIIEMDLDENKIEYPLGPPPK